MILQICAAASLSLVLPKIEPDAKYSFDASSKIAKQAKAGAPCDVVIVADEEWAKWIEAEVKEYGQRQVIASNRLVWIRALDAKTWPQTIAQVAALPPERLALAGEAVPAGRYAKAALEAAGVWSAVSGHVVRAEHVQAALAWVARQDADAGIVYASDALSEPKVRVAFMIEERLHPKILYFAFATTRGRAFLETLASAAARREFVGAGFSVAP